MPRIAINGFGRIGRQVLKAAWGKRGFDIVAINDLTDSEALAYLLKYDSNYGTWDKQVKWDKTSITIGRTKIPVYAEKDPTKLPWKKHKIDVVIESTGFFRTEELASLHVKAGARKVLISAPAKDENIPTFVFGANEDAITGVRTAIANNASCTTNCTAPVMAIMDAAFGVEKAMLSTVHGYTATQRLVDGPHKDLRRGRAAAVNMIPTSTGAAIATTETLPHLAGKFDGMAIRIPLSTVSLSDITMLLKKDVTVEGVHKAFKKAVRTPRYKGIVAITELPLVSSDIIGDPHSAIIDFGMTRVVDGNLVKVIAWYDNEWGYANRLAEMAMVFGRTK
ncbi:MAG: type I glyceraldehyde-3-phosphate dehydrogenase [bacterium]|nr:type I glyceraldehyde-3-phosphate dehydrogenase [bacterium]